MRNQFRQFLAVAAFCGVGASISCGTDPANMAQDEQPQLKATSELLSELTEDYAPRGGENSEECKKINARMTKHGRALARTKAFKAMIRTQEFKDLAKDIVALKRKGCSMSPGGGGEGGGGIDFECITLQIQAYQHQQALAATAEYKAVEKTRAFKRLSADMQEAQSKGCIKMIDVIEAL